VKLSGGGVIRQAGDHAARLARALARGRDLVIDVGGLESADLSVVQLIEATRISCARRGLGVRLAAPADGALRDVLTRGGFLDPAQPDRSEFWIHTATPQ
jgi:hypothetical protein